MDKWTRQGEEGQSKLRNPALANLLKDIPGYMEHLGSGIRFMLDETKRLDLPGPQFREMGEFVVTFQKAPALMSPRPQTQYTETLWGGEEAARLEILSQEHSISLRRNESGVLLAKCWVWGEAGNEHDMLLSCRLLSCLLAVAGGSTCLLKRCLYSVS